MGDTKPGGLPSDLCAYCREPFASLRDMYSTAITIEVGGHAWKYAVPGPLHRQCCIAGAKQYRQRLIQPTVKDLCALVSALDDAGKREVAKSVGYHVCAFCQTMRAGTWEEARDYGWVHGTFGPGDDGVTLCEECHAEQGE